MESASSGTRVVLVMERSRRYDKSRASSGLRGAASLASWWLQFLAHARADHNVLTEWEYRAPCGERKIGQSHVSRDAEAAVVSRQVAKNGFPPFVPDDGVLLADSVARGGGTRR